MIKTQKEKHTTKSCSSRPTAVSPMQKGILDLGRALVEELGLDPGVDTLSRWMAHYITELIEDAKAAKGEDRTAKLSKCADAILKLWEHHHHLPSGKRPFEDLEPILRTLESLDPDNNTPRYFRTQRSAVDENKEAAETRKWLELADGLDYSAKILICFCLAQAAQTALDKSKDWVKLAEAIGWEDSIDLPVIRFIADERDLLNDNEPDERARKQLNDRIMRLDGFKKMTESILSDLRRQLKKADSIKASS